MDELLISRLKALETENEQNISIIQHLQDKIKLNTINTEMLSLLSDKKVGKDNANEDIEMCKKFLNYYLLLLPHSINYTQVSDITSYIKNKHQNIMTTAFSITKDNDRDIYLNLEEREDMLIFISWFEQHFKNNQEKDEGEYT